MNQKNPLSIDELEAMLRMRERLDDAFEAYILRASEAELDELLLASGIDPATAQERVLASVSEAAQRLNEPAPTTASEELPRNSTSKSASTEEMAVDAEQPPNVPRKPKTTLRDLGALASSQVRTVPFKPRAPVSQNAAPVKNPVGGRRNAGAQRTEVVLGLAKRGSQQQSQPRSDDDNFIDTVEISGRQFSAYRDRTQAAEILLVGDFDPSWTFLMAGTSSWPLRATEREDTRRCESLGQKLFKRVLAAHMSGETPLQFGSNPHDQA